MELISEEVKDAQIFSIQIDTCKDISVKEQLSLILRYVKDGKIYETFAGFLERSKTTGLALLQIVEAHLLKYKIDIGMCVASATDGASNMRGEFRGFQAHLENRAGGQVSVWCYSHVLNLVMTELCKGNLIVIELFDLLNEGAKFIRYTYQRMNIFEENREYLDAPTQKRLQLIGATRWWSSEKGLTNVMGRKNKPEAGLFVLLVLTLEFCSGSSITDPKIRSKAQGLLDKFSKYELLVTAHLFMNIFEITTPLSKYLQTKGLDVLQEHKMVQTAINQLKEQAKDFSNIFVQTDAFVSFASSKLREAKSNIELKTEFAARRGRRRRRFFDEDEVELSDQTNLSPREIFEKDVIKASYDSAIRLLNDKFKSHKELSLDLHLLDPRNFSIINSSLPENAFSKLTFKVKGFFPEFDAGEFISELKSFAASWHIFRKDIHVLYEEEAKSSNNLDIEEIDDALATVFGNEGDEIPEFAKCDLKCQSEEGCSLCVFRYLEKYNLYSMSYKNLWLVYKYVLTLSIGQVECERTFSKMKIIKSRLRSTLSEANFVNLTQIYCEKRLLNDVNIDEVIERLSRRSKTLHVLLAKK